MHMSFDTCEFTMLIWTVITTSNYTYSAPITINKKSEFPANSVVMKEITKNRINITGLVFTSTFGTGLGISKDATHIIFIGDCSKKIE